MARRWLVVLLLVTIHACASQPFKPDVPPPTWEQIEQLAFQISESRTPAASEPHLTVYPRFAFAGNAVWLTCYIPEHLGPGRLRFGIEGVQMSGPMPIERIENRRLVERLPEGELVASCTIWTWERRIHLTQPLLVKGPDG